MNKFEIIGKLKSINNEELIIEINDYNNNYELTSVTPCKNMPKDMILNKEIYVLGHIQNNQLKSDLIITIGGK